MTDTEHDVPAPKLLACVELFNAGRYYDAHEAFEELWLAGEGSDSDLYKGLVQASMCLYHFADGNLEGARSLYRGHRRYLAAYQDDGRGLDVGRLLVDMQACLRPVVRAGDGEAISFDADRAPRIHSSSVAGDDPSPP